MYELTIDNFKKRLGTKELNHLLGINDFYNRIDTISIQMHINNRLDDYPFLSENDRNKVIDSVFDRELERILRYSVIVYVTYPLFSKQESKEFLVINSVDKYDTDIQIANIKNTLRTEEYHGFKKAEIYSAYKGRKFLSGTNIYPKDLL